MTIFLIIYLCTGLFVFYVVQDQKKLYPKEDLIHNNYIMFIVCLTFWLLPASCIFVDDILLEEGEDWEQINGTKESKTLEKTQE